MHVWPLSSEPRSKSRSLVATDEELRAEFEALTTARDVARLLDVPYWQLTYLIHRSESSSRYTSAGIRKKTGGIRRLLIPRLGLMCVQRKLLQVLTAVYRPKPCVLGFVKNGSSVKNAKRHVKRNWILNLDVLNFFPTINFGRVRGMFLAKPYSLPRPVATMLAQICCHENQLPQGSPTSPIVSNMVCARFDGDLLGLAKRYRLSYTRFADDLTFSTTMKQFPTEIAYRSGASPLATLGTELIKVFSNNGFESNPKKCRLQSSRERQEVTGITVSVFPNVPRSFVKRMRAMIHAWEKFGYENAELEHRKKRNRQASSPNLFRNVIRGHLGYLTMVRGRADPIVTSIRARYAKLDPAFAVSHPRSLHDLVCSSLWILECEDAMIQGTAFAVSGLGLLTCDHVIGTATLAFDASHPDKKVPVEVVARCPELDLAVLRISSPITEALSLDTSYKPCVGDQVNVAGFPNYQVGDSAYFLPQRIASLRPASGHMRALVTGPIAAGMSGGPVVAAEGQVIGVIVSGAERLSQANMTERHGFIPLQTILKFLRDNGFS